MGRKFLAVVSAAGFALALAHGSALATHTKDEAGCVNAMNKNLGKMIKFKGKDFTKCVKDASKGKVANAQTCFDSDPKSKIAGQTAKTLADETKKCTMGGGPSGYTSGAIVNSSGEGAVEDLVEDVFGGPMSIQTTKVEGGCQAAVTKRLQKIVDAKMKTFVKCKKDLLKANGDAIDGCVTGSAGIAGDPKGKQGKAITKLGDDITKKCPGGVATSLFPGQCDGLDGTALRDCLDRLAECRVCLAINTADGLSVDCDLFDDGLANSSCPPSPPIGDHKCTLDTGSQIDLFNALLNQNLASTGAVDISCGPIDGGTGKASCECGVQDPGFGPLNIGPGLFWACVKPATTACPAGEIDCDGGNALGLDLDGNTDINGNNPGNVAPCTSDADCQADCAAFCGGNNFQSFCEGFCQGDGTTACTTDAFCGGMSLGSCNGRDGVPLGNSCDCTCLDDAAGGASSAGDLQCQLAFNLTVEGFAGTPCDGVGVTINVGDTCAPLSSQSAVAIANNRDDNGVPNGPFGPVTGAPIDCSTLETSSTSGLELVGAAAFYGSTVGDILTGLTVVCQ